MALGNEEIRDNLFEEMKGEIIGNRSMNKNEVYGDYVKETT